MKERKLQIEIKVTEDGSLIQAKVKGGSCERFWKGKNTKTC